MNRSLVLLVSSLAFHGYLRAANLGGSDDFDDNVKDTTKWGADSRLGTLPGTLTETNTRLEFTTTGIEESFVRRPWILNLGSYTENWEIQIDTTVTTVAGFGRAMGFTMEVQKVGASDLRMGIGHESAQTSWDYYSFFLNSSGTQGSATTPAATAGALRITFDATAKILSSFYDGDGPGNGYLWTQLASFGIAGSGGQTGTADWGMTSGDQFQVMVEGSALSRSVSSGLVYADNFRAVPEPSVVVMLIGGGYFLVQQRRRRLP